MMRRISILRRVTSASFESEDGGPAVALLLTGLLLGVPLLSSGCGDAESGGRQVLAEAEVTTVVEAGASNPTVAYSGPDRPVHIAWVAAGGLSSDVFLATAQPTAESTASDQGRTFGDPVRVNHIPGDAAPHAQAPARVAAGPGDAVYVLWQNNTPIEGRRFPASDLRFARSSDGGRTFEPAIYVNDDAGGTPTSHSFHDMAVAPDGTIYASWIDGRASEGAAEEDGDVGSQIRVARSTDGGRSFGPNVLVADRVCPCCRTSLAIASDGTVFVAWREVFEGSVRDIVVARSTDGGESFSAATRVHEDGWVIDACPHAGPALAVDGERAVHVAWFTGAEGAAGVYHAVSGDGAATFGSPDALTPTGAIPTSQVKMSAGEDGSLGVVWEDPRGVEATIRLGVLTRDGAPGGRESPRRVAPVDFSRLDVERPSGVLPEVSVAGDGMAVAWLDGGAIRILMGREVAH